MSLIPIYCFSGLGADYRVFKHLENVFNLIHIEWIEPYKGETLENYTSRITENITFPKEFYLLGLSFGGVVAQVLAKKIKPKKLILLSTFTLGNSAPSYYKLFVNLKLNHLFIPNVFSKFSVINNFIFGASNKEDRTLLKHIIKDTSRNFFVWATKSIVLFTPKRLNSKTIYLHGNKDIVITFKNVNRVHAVNNAGHFLTLSHPLEIKNILNEHLT